MACGRPLLPNPSAGGARTSGALTRSFSPRRSASALPTPAAAWDEHGLAGTQRDPLAALVMCGPFRVDYSFIDGKEIIRKGEFCAFDVEAAMADHAGVMERIYASAE